MSHRVASSQLFPGAHAISLWGGLGLTGAEIPSTGDNGASPLSDDSPIAGAEYRLVVTAQPSAGTLVFYPDTSFEFSGAPDGAYHFTYQGFENGVSYGSATDTLIVGGVANAPGGAGTSTGSGSGGVATGGAGTNALAPGGTGTSTGSGSGGAAAGGAGSNAIALGGAGISHGSGRGGAATGGGLVAYTQAPLGGGYAPRNERYARPVQGSTVRL